MKFVNLTSKPVIIALRDKPLINVKPSGIVPSIHYGQIMTTIDKRTFIIKKALGIEGLPEKKDGHVYIVDASISDMSPLSRDDLLVPGRPVYLSDGGIGFLVMTREGD